MKALNTLFLAAAFFSASAAVQAADTTFAGVTYGQTSDKIKKSGLLSSNTEHLNTDGIISKDGTWGVRVGQMNDQGRYYLTYDNVSNDHSGLKVRQENLLGSYDMFYPLGTSTKLFGGASAGLTKLSQESSGYSRDTDTGYAIGLQAGVLQQVSDNASVELGYRYLRSNASTELAEHGGPKVGTLRLDSSAQTYLSANYLF
ncbi:outer membrane beta-barrel protein [Pseudomonas sp. P66]|jgi:opacity protein-like surface antigen|uniref:Outer membrane beta-barrel protein n=2 Tax=Pseudomonas TaxID=286 RepID=A0AB35WY62_9PSED|nr:MULTISPECIES: outer membrane beta-barrel protein [Pseudomonas]MBM3106819.1 outer membrane beta-barrel protein [Pseudomonas arcuscaelestis]MBM3111715.1 outer membrane beta-barrel protein [Pseudomonas arcuscaelestis]MBM5460412.1 outer membrane beta-barrel protein [Pseudomonas arcuscaelestis]MEE1867019.1 outer membrane beta-barrel protein [Pseudomonas sp. 120P]MEE1957846.1 outer membrane beta-barrel protein [Pseudomonas sp. 119P]